MGIRHRLVWFGSVLLLASSLAVSPASAISTDCTKIVGNLVLNCGFEDEGVPPEANSLLVGTTSMGSPGWSITDNDVNVNGAGTNSTFALTGSGYAYLGEVAPNPATLTATLTQNTVADRSYFVSFWLAISTDVGNSTFFSASFGNDTNFLVLANLPDQGYTQYTATVVPGPNAKLTFDEFNNDSFFYLDDVSVVAIPQPAGVWLLLFGLGAFTAARWRRSTRRSRQSRSSARSTT